MLGIHHLVSAMTDQQIIVLYETWSENAYAATFIDPRPHHIQQFYDWLSDEMFPEEDRELEDYEIEMLEAVRAMAAKEQEKEKEQG